MVYEYYSAHANWNLIEILIIHPDLTYLTYLFNEIEENGMVENAPQKHRGYTLNSVKHPAHRRNRLIEHKYQLIAKREEITDQINIIDVEIMQTYRDEQGV